MPELAAITGLTDRRLRQLATEGQIPKPVARGRYDFAKTLPALFKFYRHLADARAANSAEREALARARREKVEFETNLLAGRYVPTDRARNARRGAIRVLHVLWRRHLENDWTKERAEWLRPYLTPELLHPWAEFDKALAVKTVDAVENEFSTALQQDLETELARYETRKQL